MQKKGAQKLRLNPVLLTYKIFSVLHQQGQELWTLHSPKAWSIS